jgi:hypothetical protein
MIFLYVLLMLIGLIILLPILWFAIWYWIPTDGPGQNDYYEDFSNPATQELHNQKK